MVDILIKNMVCPRCIMAVENVLNQQKIGFEKVELGKVRLNAEMDKATFEVFETEIEKLGFEILKDRDVQRIEKIKNLFTLLFQKEELPSGLNISTYINSHIPEDYSMLSHLFSSMEGITIEKYFISLKIEKVKEWLFYEELTLSEMAYKLDYSSVQHLSSQFKKITGMTPSEYRKLRKDGGKEVGE
ncbi:AraC family transcriptional regulator [Aquiflexum sp. LQ15W]|uniref:AraC family transcriptional regulator n=1 Tax=Cognataquiflexum nitidum TaxID=2922272 RepID=UPI001F129C10|nr:AraC family transcriptional regulator [Cognataquiflexum nitidum]MCH6201712.1 AraC family transcriptional regulator [Cognataquiflexum nitidum]